MEICRITQTRKKVHLIQGIGRIWRCPEELAYWRRKYANEAGTREVILEDSDLYWSYMEEKDREGVV
jgi:hypothetical protein